MTASDGETVQDLDQSEDEENGPLRAWSFPPQPGTKYLGIKAAEIKPRGRTYKTASLRFFGDDPENPSKARLEIKQCPKIPGGGGFDFDHPTHHVSLENNEIKALKAFLNDEFNQDGHYVRVETRDIAKEVAKYGSNELANLLLAVADKTELVKAIRETGQADFLTGVLLGQKNLDTLETLREIAANPESDELSFQRILQDNPWMFGGQFVGVEATRTLTTQDQIDIALVTGDGSLHIVELKRANIPKLVVPYRNHLIVGKDVHEAVSQAENYLRSLDEEAHTIKSKLGFEAHRVFATVVIGHINHNTEDIEKDDFYRTLRTYNSHLTRVQVITYDQLIANAMNSLELTAWPDCQRISDDRAASR
ncbi:Shedu anti-phage system protein SduA domain-containing protein [Mycolicibacterium fortuitum]